jgi:murein DD-endopeptidase MepM/ murein hydrolase activator NlpD
VFGARRDEGKRKHAGCDLYAKAETPVIAMANGVVYRDLYHFYDVVWAVTVLHEIYTVVYGELEAGSFPVGLRKGTEIKAGQFIGTVGKMKKWPQPMLHLEMYKDHYSESLLDRKRSPYCCRVDPVDSTPFLDALSVWSGYHDVKPSLMHDMPGLLKKSPSYVA